MGEAGFPLTDDFNGPHFEGGGIYDSTIRGGQRCSAAKAYLTPEVRRRPNLRILTGALAHAVTFSGGAVAGVRYARGGGVEALACHRVVLCGGAVNSPQTLMLSGIGPRGALGRARHPGDRRPRPKWAAICRTISTCSCNGPAPSRLH